MKLTYRGLEYEPESFPLDVTEGEIGGKYRGQHWRYRYLRHIPELQPQHPLTYRGASYQMHPRVENSTPAKATPPVRATRQQAFNSLSQIHLAHLRRNLERRMQVAQASGNTDLLHLLEQESQQLTLH